MAKAVRRQASIKIEPADIPTKRSPIKKAGSTGSPKKAAKKAAPKKAAKKAAPKKAAKKAAR